MTKHPEDIALAAVQMEIRIAAKTQAAANEAHAGSKRYNENEAELVAEAAYEAAYEAYRIALIAAGGDDSHQGWSASLDAAIDALM